MTLKSLTMFAGREKLVDIATASTKANVNRIRQMEFAKLEHIVSARVDIADCYPRTVTFLLYSEASEEK